MPSKSAKQHKTMQAVEHSVEFSKKIGIPQNVAKEYMKADKTARKFQGKARGKRSRN